jgi:hypothetical protein
MTDTMTIVLLKDHEDAAGTHRAGETISVSPETHAWLTSVYLAERLALVAELEAEDAAEVRTRAKLRAISGGRK